VDRVNRFLGVGENVWHDEARILLPHPWFRAQGGMTSAKFSRFATDTLQKKRLQYDKLSFFNVRKPEIFEICTIST
jgi:hypothetical protein